MNDSPIRVIRLLEEYFPGSLIGGKYRLDAVVGQGGMGSIWRATNVVLDMPVAMKLIRPEVRGAASSDMLLHEARFAAKLQHPSVVRLFDFGVAKTGDAYIVMELLKGPSLADLLERHGKLKPIAAVRLLLPILHGLSAAHRRGIVHLDLKPENIVISEQGLRRQPKLLDFGIAKKIGLHNNATAQETLVGSPSYMSPEQACGQRDIDARADIWGICVVLYELVAGHTPFIADTPSETLKAVIENEPLPLGVGEADDYDTRALWTIVREGLAKDPEHRYSNVRELGDALAQWLIDCDEHHDVCGEQLASNWRLAAPALEASAPLRLASEKRAANDTGDASRSKKRWRTAWVGAAACLSVAVPALLLMHTEATQPASLHAAMAVDAGIAHSSAGTRASAPLAHNYSAPSSQPLSAATEAAREVPDEHVEQVLAKPTSTSPDIRTTVRTNRLSAKRPQGVRSREAKLGLKDPFE